jgi:hypothetical protein
MQREDRVVAERMTEALIMSCPHRGCTTRFIHKGLTLERFFKEEACNKIQCTSCKGFSCYHCRAAVDSGYAHFGLGELAAGSSRVCPLYYHIENEDGQGTILNNAKKVAKAELRARREFHKKTVY